MAEDTHRISLDAPEDLWRTAQARAAENGEPLRAVLIRAMEDYVTKKHNEPAAPPTRSFVSVRQAQAGRERVTFYFDPDQLRWLRKVALNRNVTLHHLVDASVREYRQKQ